MALDGSVRSGGVETAGRTRRDVAGDVVGGSKAVTWQRWNRGFRIWDTAGRGTGRWSHNHLNIHR
jgi:hypothetical protein